MIALYMDENVHGAITRELRKRNIDILRIQDDGYMGRKDNEVLDRATTLARVLFSQDDDLLREARKRQSRGETFGGVIYAHQVDVSLGQCIADLEYFAQAGMPEDFVEQVYFLPL